MSDILTQPVLQIDAELEVTLSQLFAEMERLNEQTRQDQADIDRLKAETRVISAHSDRLLLQIEAQLELLRKVA